MIVTAIVIYFMSNSTFKLAQMVDVQHCSKTLTNCGITTISFKYLTLPETFKFYLYSLITLVGNMANVRSLLLQKRLMLTHTRNSKQKHL